MDSSVQYPDHWPDLPDTVHYCKDRSEEYSVESEPEYVIQTLDRYIEFVLRKYEDGTWQIQPSYPLTARSQKFESEEEFLDVYSTLLRLLDTNYLHSPPKSVGSSVELRGYHTTEEVVYEYTQNGEITSKPPSTATIADFGKGVGWNIGMDVGDLLAYTEQTVVTPYTYTYYFENSAIVIQDTNNTRKQKLIPIPDRDILINTLSQLDNKINIKYICDSLKVQLVGKVL